MLHQAQQSRCLCKVSEFITLTQALNISLGSGSAQKGGALRRRDSGVGARGGGGKERREGGGEELLVLLSVRNFEPEK